MPDIDLATAATLLAAPETSAHELADVAARFPELWPQVIAHPQVYPDLVDWIRRQQTTQPAATPVAAVAPEVASVPGPSDTVTQREPRPRPRSRSRRWR